MRDYVKELMETWTGKGEQAAHSQVRELLNEICGDVVRLRKQEEAIQALSQVLRDHPDVDTSTDPVDVPSGLEPIEPLERSRFIVEASEELFREYRERQHWEDNSPILINCQDVYTSLKHRGLDLGVQQPLAVIGTVLNSAKGFHRVARNTFQYTREEKSGPVPYDETDDLPF